MAKTLAGHDLGTNASRLDTVEAALDRWDSPAARVAAISNGSAADAVHAAAVERWPDRLDEPYERELLAINLTKATDEARSKDALKPAASPVNETATTLRDALREKIESRVKAAVKRRAAKIAARLPKGVPVVPAPGLWYAMVNAWHIEVRGSYARFVVRVPRGAPDRLPADLRYVRENATVRLDVDGDGSPERLGRNRRVTFTAETVVGIAVPPRPRGVGDVSDADERSPGWPDPGPTDAG